MTFSCVLILIKIVFTYLISHIRHVKIPIICVHRGSNQYVLYEASDRSRYDPTVRRLSWGTDHIQGTAFSLAEEHNRNIEEFFIQSIFSLFSG